MINVFQFIEIHIHFHTKASALLQQTAVLLRNVNGLGVLIVTQPKDQTLQVPITLALSMPVFITPPNARRRLECELQRPDAQTLGTRCANVGNAYAQVRGVILRRDDKELARFEGGAYILPGARKFMRVEAGSSALPGPAQMDVQFDDGTVQSQAVNLP